MPAAEPLPTLTGPRLVLVEESVDPTYPSVGLDFALSARWHGTFHDGLLMDLLADELAV